MSSKQARIKELTDQLKKELGPDHALVIAGIHRTEDGQIGLIDSISGTPEMVSEMIQSPDPIISAKGIIGFSELIMETKECGVKVTIATVPSGKNKDDEPLTLCHYSSSYHRHLLAARLQQMISVARTAGMAEEARTYAEELGTRLNGPDVSEAEVEDQFDSLVAEIEEKIAGFEAQSEVKDAISH